MLNNHHGLLCLVELVSPKNMKLIKYSNVELHDVTKSSYL